MELQKSIWYATTTRDKMNLRNKLVLSLARYRIGGPAAFQTPCLPGGAEGPPQTSRQGAQPAENSER